MRWTLYYNLNCPLKMYKFHFKTKCLPLKAWQVGHLLVFDSSLCGSFTFLNHGDLCWNVWFCFCKWKHRHCYNPGGRASLPWFSVGWVLHDSFTEWSNWLKLRSRIQNVTDSGYWHQAESAFPAVSPGPPIPTYPNAQAGLLMELRRTNASPMWSVPCQGRPPPIPMFCAMNRLPRSHSYSLCPAPLGNWTPSLYSVVSQR